MNQRNNITLNQKAFNRLMSYLEEANNEVCKWVKQKRYEGCYFKADYDEKGSVTIAALNKNHDINALYVLSWSDPLEASQIQNILFYTQQRVDDF